MSNDVDADQGDADLRRLFAENREEVADAAFTAAVSQRVARLRHIDRLIDIGMAVGFGLAAAAVAPMISDAVNALTLKSLALSTASTQFAGAPLVWIGATAAAGIIALVWTRA